MTANKYRDALLMAGAMVEVCPSDKSPANTPVKSPAPARPVPVEPGSGSWTLAPVGSDLLPANYRSSSPSVQIDSSSLSLRPAEGNLVDAAEVSNEMAAVGENLVNDDEKLQLPLVEIELEDWEIAAPGSDLLAAEERPVVVPVVVANSDFGLAPVGSDLGQLKPQVKPLAPDTSKLRIME
jgi:hypothetical protein